MHGNESGEDAAECEGSRVIAIYKEEAAQHI